MFAVLYKWRIDPQLEQQFIDAWSEITRYYLENAGSHGSCLHKGSDGLWYAYAQWPSDKIRQAAFTGDELNEASEKMRAAILERFDETRLEVVANLIENPTLFR